VDRLFFYAKAVGAVRHIVQNYAEPLATDDAGKKGRRNIVTPKRAKEPGAKPSENRAWNNHQKSPATQLQTLIPVCYLPLKFILCDSLVANFVAEMDLS
jgi:hypothetical protein